MLHEVDHRTRRHLELRQERTFHRVGRWRPGQDPPSETSVLPGKSLIYVVTPSIETGSRIQKKTVEMPQLQFVDEVVDISIVIQRHVQMLHTVQKTAQVLQVQYTDCVVDVPVIKERHVPIKIVQEMVQVPEMNTKLDTRVTISMQRSKTFCDMTSSVRIASS